MRQWRLAALGLVVVILAAGCTDDAGFSEDAVAEDAVPEDAGAEDAVAEDAVPEDAGVVTGLVLTSPSGGTAQISGNLVEGQLQVSLDGTVQPAPAVQAPLGPFTLTMEGLEPGAHTVCVNDVCERVMVKGPPSVSIGEIKERVDRAWERVATVMPVEDLLPGWQIVLEAPTAGVGGTTVADAKTIVIGTHDRTVDEFFLTLVHEAGHALDVEYLTDVDRQRFRKLRGFPVDAPWSASGFDVRDWSVPAEDFAEVVAAIVIDSHVPRSVGAQLPDDATIAAVREMTGLSP